MREHSYIGCITFKFHYGKIHIETAIYINGTRTIFKFHYGKIHILVRSRPRQVYNLFKFHYGKIHIVLFPILMLFPVTLNSTMVRFIFIKKYLLSSSALVFKFHYGKIHIQLVSFFQQQKFFFKFHYGKIHIVCTLYTNEKGLQL